MQFDMLKYTYIGGLLNNCNFLHNTSISRSHDVTDQLWWRHNARSEKAALGNNGEMSARW